MRRTIENHHAGAIKQWNDAYPGNSQFLDALEGEYNLMYHFHLHNLPKSIFAQMTSYVYDPAQPLLGRVQKLKTAFIAVDDTLRSDADKQDILSFTKTKSNFQLVHQAYTHMTNLQPCLDACTTEFDAQEIIGNYCEPSTVKNEILQKLAKKAALDTQRMQHNCGVAITATAMAAGIGAGFKGTEVALRHLLLPK